MVEVLVAVSVLAGVGLLVGLYRSIRSGSGSRPASRAAAPARPVDRPAPSVPVPSVPVPRVAVPASPEHAPDGRLRPEQPLAFAEPGSRGDLLVYGGECAGYLLRAPFAVLAVDTTGFSPGSGDRLVEIAVARVDASGRIEDEYATLLDPGRDVGPVFVHGISNLDIREAPRFADVAGDLLARMDGAVVVAHNAAFVDRFLAAEFARAGIELPPHPALDSLWLARRTLRTPNHALGTLARAAGLAGGDAHTALGDVRALAGLLPQMLDLFARPPQYPCGFGELPQVPPAAGPRTREPEPRPAGDGWMVSLMARLPQAAARGGDADAQRYLDSLAVALADGRVAGSEDAALARLAASAGLGEAQVAVLHRRLLESLRSAAMAADILTTTEIRQLRTAAALVGQPGWFDELRATAPADLIARQRAAAARLGG